MMKHDWLHNNKKRRQEQIRSIREGIVRNPQPLVGFREQDWDGFKDSLVSEWGGLEKKESTTKKGNAFILHRLLKKFLIASALFVLTIMMFQTKSPAMEPVERFVVQVMTQDFRFAEFKTWVQRVTGGSPAILPAFISGKSNAPMTQWIQPVQGKLALPFDPKRKGIVLEAKGGSKVVSVSEGWVVFAGKKEGLGNLVIVRHAGGKETWYGWLNKISIKEKDWVKTGQTVGQALEGKGVSYVYFALRKRGEFVNPASVIPFE